MKLYKRVTMEDRTLRWDWATPEEVVAAFRELPLTTQMRAAADVLVEAGKRSNPDGSNHGWGGWSANGLAGRAAQWDREDAEKAKQDNEIEELAQALAKSAGYATPDSMAYKRAQDLYGWGWRKGGDDD